MRRAHRYIFLGIALLAIGTFIFGLVILAGALRH